jgi:lysine-specific permease
MAEQGSGDLQRGLKTRHVNMIAIGGAIGTGLFLALAGSLNDAGPGGALVAYGIMGIMVYFLMTSLGEMSTFMPVTGSFETYATKFVHPSFGFSLGWNYWYNWVVTVACEIAAVPVLVSFWGNTGNQFLWAAIAAVLLFLLNYFAVAVYGEAEFWFAGIKVVTIIVFLVLGVLTILGIMKSDAYTTANVLANWKVGEAPFVGGIGAIIGVFMIAGFSFQGTELIGVASGEVKDPQKAIPKAIRTVFFRIMLFYIGAIVIIGFLLPYNDANLANAGSIQTSPFTLIFEHAGIAIAASIMNTIIITSVLSCGNSGMFASTRMLYSLAVEGKAPKIFTKVNKRGVPVPALLCTFIVAVLLYCLGRVGVADASEDGLVYTLLVNCSSLSGFIAWFGIAVCHFKFRKAFIAQGHRLDELKYRALLFPFGPIFAAALVVFVIAGQFFIEDGSSWNGMLTLIVYAAYVGALVVLFFVHKAKTGSKWIKPEDGDFSQGFAKAEKE